MERKMVAGIHVSGFSMKNVHFPEKLKNRSTIKEGTVAVPSLDPSLNLG